MHLVLCAHQDTAMRPEVVGRVQAVEPLLSGRVPQVCAQPTTSLGQEYKEGLNGQRGLTNVILISLLEHCSLSVESQGVGRELPAVKGVPKSKLLGGRQALK
jgi:hypothetical protein